MTWITQCSWARWGLAAVTAAALVSGGCGRRAPPARHAFLAMGTVGSLALPPDSSPAGAAALVTNVFGALEARLSLFRPGSELARLNARAAQGGAAVTPELWDLLASALAFSKSSGGAFDVTVGPLMQCWGFRGGPALTRAPTPDEIRPFLERTGYRHITLSNGVMTFDRPGLQIDLGGIAKGYAVDRACAALLERGVTQALVNLGGNMRALGRPGRARPWTVGVRDPFAPGRQLGTLALADGQAVATSGHYERFVTIEGRRYAHILDPRTGVPVRGMAGVTVLAPTALEADALSTTLFVQGLPDGLATLAGRPGCAALFVPDRQPPALWVTPGFDAVFTPAPRAQPWIRRLEPTPAHEGVPRDALETEP